ncbi:hypothetical protein GCM10028805_44010 [Spirosoma harenae]
MALPPRFLKAYNNVSEKVQYWAWPQNTFGRYVSAFIANYIFTHTTNKVVTDGIPDGGITGDLLPTGDLQELTDQGAETNDYLITGGYTMIEYPQAGDDEIVGVPVITKRQLDWYNQGKRPLERLEVVPLANLKKRLAELPDQVASVITFTILGHQVEWPNLIAIDFEQKLSDPTLNNNAGYWDLVIYIRSSVNIAETRSLQNDAPYTEEVGVTGNYGGNGYTRQAGYSNVPPSWLARFEYRYPGQPGLLFAMDWEVPNNAVARSTVYQANLSNARTRLSLQKTTTPASGPATNQTVYLVRSPGETCSLDDAYFNNLDQTQKLSLTTSIEPVATLNKHWENRDCDGGGTSGDFVFTTDPLIEGGGTGNQTTNSTPVAP